MSACRVEDLPLRMTATEVCALAHCSKVTLYRRRKANPAWLPMSPMKLGKEQLFDRADVLRALALTTEEHANDDGGWEVDGDAIREARSGTLRQRPRPARGRDVPGAVRTPTKASALRLVADNAPADRRGSQG